MVSYLKKLIKIKIKPLAKLDKMSVGFLTPLSSQIYVGHSKPSASVGHSTPFYVGFLLKPHVSQPHNFVIEAYVLHILERFW